MICIGLAGTLMKLLKWDESAMFFDGTSLGTCLFFFPVPKLSLRSTGFPTVTDKTSGFFPIGLF